MGFLFKTLIVLAALAVQLGLSSGRLGFHAAAMAATALVAGYAIVSMIRFKGDRTAGGRNVRAALGAGAVALVALYPIARTLFPSIVILKFLLAASMIALLIARLRKLRLMERLDSAGARNEFDSLLGKCLHLLPEVAQARLTASDIMMWKHLFGRVRPYDKGVMAVFAISRAQGKGAGMRRIAISAACLVAATAGLSFLSSLATVIVAIVLSYSLVLKIAQARSAKFARIAVYEDKLIVIDGHFAYITVPRSEISAVRAISANRHQSSASSRTLKVGDDATNLLISFEPPQAAILPFGLATDYTAILIALSPSDCQSLERVLDAQDRIDGTAADANGLLRPNNSVKVQC